jgi:hypothetical protein
MSSLASSPNFEPYDLEVSGSKASRLSTVTPTAQQLDEAKMLDKSLPESVSLTTTPTAPCGAHGFNGSELDYFQIRKAKKVKRLSFYAPTFR